MTRAASTARADSSLVRMPLPESSLRKPGPIRRALSIGCEVSVPALPPLRGLGRDDTGVSMSFGRDDLGGLGVSVIRIARHIFPKLCANLALRLAPTSCLAST